MLDTAPLEGIVIIMDTAEHWLSSGSYIPGVTGSADSGNTLDEGVCSIKLDHVHCGESLEFAPVTDRICQSLAGIKGCSYESIECISGSFIGNADW